MDQRGVLSSSKPNYPVVVMGKVKLILALAVFALAQDGFTTAVEAAKEKYGATRIGVFLGTSTAGIQHTENAYRRRDSGTRCRASR